METKSIKSNRLARLDPAGGTGQATGGGKNSERLMMAD